MASPTSTAAGPTPGATWWRCRTRANRPTPPATADDVRGHTPIIPLNRPAAQYGEGRPGSVGRGHTMPAADRPHTSSSPASSPSAPLTSPGEGEAKVSRSLARVLSDVAAERAAQDEMWGLQDLPDGCDPGFAAEADQAKETARTAWTAGELSWRHVLVEEVFEALAEDAPGRLRAELVQVAAVAVKWIEALDRRAGRLPHPTRRGGRAEKLVRDRIPEIIETAGGSPSVRVADRPEYRALLRVKLYEEAGEYAASGDPDELADLLEVVQALARTHGLDPNGLERARAAKAAERGGFDERLVLRLRDEPRTEVRRSFRHSARALLLDGDALILLRRVKPGRELFWTTPGGGVEPQDEHPEATLVRELDEELGATVGPPRQVFAYAERNPLADYLHTFYLCRL